MADTLWSQVAPKRRRRRRKVIQLPLEVQYSITGKGNDCEIIGHTLNTYDLAGTTTCMDCGARIFCPQCIDKHPTEPQAVPVLCPLHE